MQSAQEKNQGDGQGEGAAELFNRSTAELYRQFLFCGRQSRNGSGDISIHSRGGLVFVFQNLFVTEHEMVLIRNATVAYLQKHGRDFLAVKKLWRKTAGCDLLKDDLGWEDVLLPQGRKMTLPFSTLGGLPGTAG
eukprot:g6012.t1